MLTPAKYWRVPCALDDVSSVPASNFILPDDLASQVSPPSRGHGITMAAFDDTEQIGMLRWIGLVVDRTGKAVTVDWKPTTAQILVDTQSGRGRWRSGSFGFAPKKIGDYGLHELWQQHFDHLELRAFSAMATRPRGSAGFGLLVSHQNV